MPKESLGKQEFEARYLGFVMNRRANWVAILQASNLSVIGALIRMLAGRSRLIGLICLVLSVGSWPEVANGAITVEQRAKLADLNSKVREAGKLYSASEFVDCTELIAEIQSELIVLLESKDTELQRMAKPIYARLGKAHGLLELVGAELEALPSWTELVSMEKPDSNNSESKVVSFKADIAPWLATACGNCHITRSRGGFSLASYRDLLRGVSGNSILQPGSARGSRLVEVIESGDMPRGNSKVTPIQLARLKLWIDQGAVFDGPSPGASLGSFGVENGMANTSEKSMPMENATVSFAKDIAPILVENCNGCHIDGRRASGGLRMDSFAQLQRGGDSGEIINGRDAGGSLLVMKLKGESGQRMPAGGRPALATEEISLITKWIQEGAVFDGPSLNTNVRILARQAWASEASHEELFSARKERALKNWSRVSPDDDPAIASNDELFVLGNVPQPRIDAVMDHLVDSLVQAKKLLKAPAAEPLIRGGIAVFVLGSRYDYSEFGRMVENRELPKDWLGHWDSDSLDAYGVLVAEAGLDEKQSRAVALQVVSGAYLGGFSEVPVWFAEGVARNLVRASFRRGDDRVGVWQNQLPHALQKVKEAKMLLDDQLDEESAGLVGMAIANFMMERTNRRRFDKMMELLRDGQTFEDATTFAFAPPLTLVKSWLGR